MIKKFLNAIMDFGEGTKGDHMGAFAAQSAFFILMSFFPIANLLLSVTVYLPFSRGELIDFFASFVPAEFESYLVSIINSIYYSNTGSITIISVIVGLWSAAKGIMAIRNGLNEVYDARERRNYFIIRALSAFYTAVFMVIIILVVVFYVFGNQIASMVIGHFPQTENMAVLIMALRNVISFIVLLAFFWGVMTRLPNCRLKFFGQLPGAVFTSLAWVLVTKLFSWYVNVYGTNSMYGSLTTIIMIMLWLYFGVYSIFLGGQMNQFLRKTNNLKTIKNEELQGEDINL